jgi:hypothetical protein
MNCNYKDGDISSAILKIVGLIILLIMIVYYSQTCSRSEHNMIQIKSGYCYEEDTKIIYLESETSRYGLETSYSAYYSENGNLCKYDETSGEWIEIKEDK